MKMSTKGRYAVMAMIDIGQHGADRPVSLNEIAERQDISQEYLGTAVWPLAPCWACCQHAGPGWWLPVVAPCC